MIEYYAKEMAFHLKKWQLAIESNEDIAAAHHKREYDNFKREHDQLKKEAGECA